MSRLGKNQLDFMASLGGVHRLVVVPDKMTGALVKRGVMVSVAKNADGFLGLTAAGYRAIADAMDAGQIVRPPLESVKKAPR